MTAILCMCVCIYIYDPFPEEYLIKPTHLQHQLQVIKWH